MGNSCVCGNVSEMCLEEVSTIRCDEPEKDRIQAVRKLFELTDLEKDGLIDVDEFVEMGLRQARMHGSKRTAYRDEASIKDSFKRKFGDEIDASLKPVPYFKYKEYILRTVSNKHPHNMKAQTHSLHCMVADAQIAHSRIMVDRALQHVHSPRLPTILTSDLGRDSHILSPKQDEYSHL